LPAKGIGEGGPNEEFRRKKRKLDLSEKTHQRRGRKPKKVA